MIDFAHTKFRIAKAKDNKILFLFVLCFLFQGLCYAQIDTAWVKHKNNKIYISHKVQWGENLFMLAGRFVAPVAATAHINNIGYQEGLEEGSIFKIPIGNYNYLRINSVVKSKPLYYKVKRGERLRSVSRLFHVSQKTIQLWNKIPLPEVFSGQVLLVGWVKFDKTKQPFTESKQPEKKSHVVKHTKLSKKDSLAKDTSVAEDSEIAIKFRFLHKDKTLKAASGAAVFFSYNAKLTPSIYYAFFNDAPRGSIIKIYNPSSHKTIYAKVIGSIPKISKYHNAVVGLSFNAAKAFQARSSKVFCKIKY